MAIKTATAVAKELMTRVLGIEHTEARGRDQLDFHDLHVDAIRAALEAAYEAGANQGRRRPGINETMANQARARLKS